MEHILRKTVTKCVEIQAANKDKTSVWDRKLLERTKYIQRNRKHIFTKKKKGVERADERKQQSGTRAMLWRRSKRGMELNKEDNTIIGCGILRLAISSMVSFSAEPDLLQNSSFRQRDWVGNRCAFCWEATVSFFSFHALLPLPLTCSKTSHKSCIFFHTFSLESV